MMRASPDTPEGGPSLFVSTFQISLAIGSLAGGVVVDLLDVRSVMYFGGLVAAFAVASIWGFGQVPDQLDPPVAVTRPLET